MPRQMRPLHQIHSPGRPEASGDVPLLVGKAVERNAKRRSQYFCLRLARQKTRHIRALDGARTCTHTNSADIRAVKSGKKRLCQLRQLLDVGKQRVGLPQAQLARLHGQKA